MWAHKTRKLRNVPLASLPPPVVTSSTPLPTSSSPSLTVDRERKNNNKAFIFFGGKMGSLRPLCRPHAVCTSLLRHRHRQQLTFSFPSRELSTSGLAGLCGYIGLRRPEKAGFSHRTESRRTVVAGASNWTSEKSPYDTLELERDADDNNIKSAYRRLAKYYHPDVYDGRGTLEEGESAEERFIKIQAAYELLIDEDKRKQYDRDNRVNPMKASQAWMEWIIKKRKAFDQRGDMAIAAWAEQQQREMNLRARRLARSKVDPEEEKRILAKEKKASMEYFSNTIKRHTLVLKKRDLMRKKAEAEKKKMITQLLAAEGLELDPEDEEP